MLSAMNVHSIFYTLYIQHKSFFLCSWSIIHNVKGFLIWWKFCQGGLSGTCYVSALTFHIFYPMVPVFTRICQWTRFIYHT
jgi:hypothetical protein